MEAELTEFEIRGLHDRYNIRVPIEQNRCVLVGANGLGKTTIISILFYTLSRQWRRLLDFQFDSVHITLAKEKITITRQDIETGSISHLALRRAARTLRMMSPSVAARLENAPEVFEELFQAQSRQELERIADNHRISPSLIERIVREMEPAAQEQLFKEATPLRVAETVIRDRIKSQILYLPTYRRIEKDLKTILPDLDEHLRKHNEMRSARKRESASHFVELVEFGMEDVEGMLERRLGALKEQAREKLNALAGNYLRDVIRGEATQYHSGSFGPMSSAAVERILSRVEERTLSEADKRKLKDVIEQIRKSPEHKLSVQEGYIAHFFARLVEIHQSLAQQEDAIEQFARICNKYLQGKRIVYDERSYRIAISTDGYPNIKFKDLSSGEKQIVSLFSHIYLSEVESMFVIVDEPELSLSVEWQKALLPDISHSRRCRFLLAVTHSPFVFDNALDSYTRDLGELIEAA
ncbi:AAA family ATPase [Archangium violaceum]|uniref:AAA family ATPase n=1 Tax=Archangium violaceum TaxID=83451 RepID=UPI0036DEDBA3